MKSLTKYAAINAFATAAYITIIASFMYISENSELIADKTLLAPIAFLMLFVFSAALTGSLVFGRPIIWYLDGRKKDALLLLVYTMSILFLITIVIIILLIIFGA